MAVAVAVLYAAQHSGPYVVGNRSCAYAKLTFASLTYTNPGGVSFDGSFESLFGFSKVHQMDILGVQYDDTPGIAGCQARWDEANQKVQLYKVGNTSDPAEVANGVDISSIEIDCCIWYDPQGT